MKNNYIYPMEKAARRLLPKNDRLEIVKESMYRVNIIESGILYFYLYDQTDEQPYIADIYTKGDCVSNILPESNILENGYFRAKTDCTFLSFSLMDVTNDRKMFMRTSETIIQHYIKNCKLVHCKNIREKLLFYFNSYYSPVKGKKFTVDISYTDIAEYLGTDRASVMREIKKMSQDGIISVEKKNITLL
ncbi:MAG TPA: hypothetical protein DCG28_06025 [Lachnospiraceae bacterium]|nr:hypothetical protein [Lachnospiraceae bacterium]